MDDHDNTLIEEQSNIGLSWRTGIYTTISNQDDQYPSVFINTLPPASYFLNPNIPLASFGGSPNPYIPYPMEWNFGVEQQLTKILVLGAHYVVQDQASVPATACEYSDGTWTGADFSFQPYPQYGGPILWDYNEGTGNPNALQIKLKQELAGGPTT